MLLSLAQQLGSRKVNALLDYPAHSAMVALGS